MKNKYDIVIIGGGVIGSAIARECSKYQFEIALIEKESDVAEGISKANSGVIHAGFNVKTGSLKAKFNIEGLKYFPGICKEIDVPYKLCKKLVIVKNNEELFHLEKLYKQGINNGCSGLSIINESKIKKLEPYVKGKYALYSEKTAIISPYQFTIALAENALANNVDFYLQSEVIKINILKNNVFLIELKNGKKIFTKIIVNSAGMFSDKISNMVEKNNNKIYPCRGEYYILDTEASKYLKMAIYPVPPLDGRGLGVHLTPTINGNILIGPSADYINERDDTRNTKKVMDVLKKEAYDLLPQLKNIPFIKNYSGIRPKLFNNKSNAVFEDFIIKESPRINNFINLIGIESPGLTGALAIAKYVVENIIAMKNELIPKKDFINSRIGITRTKFLEINKTGKLIKTDKNYGEVICRCEQVTKSEIMRAVNNPLKSITLNAIKKRTHAMMGRCQGGFCIPRITKYFTDEIGIKEENIYKKNEKSNLFLGNKD